RLPVIRWPASGFLPAYCLRRAMSPGISSSARRISLRPHSASERSLTWYSRVPLEEGAATVVVIGLVLLFFRPRSGGGSSGGRSHARARARVPWPGPRAEARGTRLRRDPLRPASRRDRRP